MAAEQSPAALAADLQAFTQVLHQRGVHAALGYLNQRTTHRYTGVFRFDGRLSRNVVLFDRYQPHVQQGNDVPLVEAFCSLIGREQASLQILNAALDPRARAVDTLVISYCGVVIYDAQGRLYGTLCHYDVDLCQELVLYLPLLEAAGALLYQALHPAC
ncbi:hypothetical protein [Hymenobacter crusticola]|uniref:GAF domain-containing protein n=1 Tax=Hymenobacter crusticola TaxID=1770526 RepID=A0A2C9ZV97_9BACT|nr:hypothetical protein [Hymenobacter crusticola]OUJ70469.1 hypothetical protein BXP70_24220 [Hymenobacter crusticola]